MALSSEHPFIERFEKAWDEPSLDRFTVLFAENVTLIQPLSKPVVGKSAARAAFAKILDQYPGIRGADVFGLGENDRVFISWTMLVPIGGKTLPVPVMDAFWLDEGLVSKRVAYFDPVPILTAAMVRPAHWLRLVKSQFNHSG